jgi:hypothetical protein
MIYQNEVACWLEEVCVLDVKNGEAGRVADSWLGDGVRAAMRMPFDEEASVERRSTCMGAERLTRDRATCGDRHAWSWRQRTRQWGETGM